MPADMAIIDDPASMKGFPRRGSDGLARGVGVGGQLASMKGFPRRGSDEEEEPTSYLPIKIKPQ